MVRSLLFARVVGVFVAILSAVMDHGLSRCGCPPSSLTQISMPGHFSPVIIAVCMELNVWVFLCEYLWMCAIVHVTV